MQCLVFFDCDKIFTDLSDFESNSPCVRWIDGIHTTCLMTVITDDHFSGWTTGLTVCLSAEMHNVVAAIDFLWSGFYDKW